MQSATTDRKFFVSVAALVALFFSVRFAHAQFAPPTCTPPNCSPAVIQNIPLAGAAQNAGINVTGDAKLGATFQAGAGLPNLNAANKNLLYGAANGASVGSLLLLQTAVGGVYTDRFRISANGDVTASGVLTAGSLSIGGASVCLQDGTHCPPAVQGSGTLNALAKFTPDGTTIGDSLFKDDGSNAAIGGAIDGNYKMRVYGSLNAAGITVTANVPTAIFAETFAAGSTGVSGTGGDYGVYGKNSAAGSGVYGINLSNGALGKGVYGRSEGNGDGVYGESFGGWGGHFSSLYVNNATLFSGGVTVGPGTKLALGTAAADSGAANGTMYYNSSTDKFRCYEGGAWKDCVSAGVGGSGAAGTIPKFTAAATLGNSTLTDDGTTVTATQNFSVNGSTTIGNAGADALTITGTAVATPNNLNFDANTLYVDAANNRVGIGSAAPGTTLAVAGTLSTTGNATFGDAAADRTTIAGELVLGSQAATPAGVNGMLYYNTLSNKFKCYEAGAWVNCAGEEDTLDTVAQRGRQISTYIGISNTGNGGTSFDTALSVRGTVGGVNAVVTDPGGTALYGAGGAVGVSGNGSTSGGTFGASSAAGVGLQANAFGAGFTAIAANGNLQVTGQAAFNGETSASTRGITTGGSIYGIQSYGRGAGQVSTYGAYVQGSGASSGNYGLIGFGVGGTTAYGVYGNASAATTNYAFYAAAGSMRTACNTNDSETDTIVCEDIAEVYETGEKTEPGDVIVWRPEVEKKVYKSRRPYEDGIAGIYSTSPGVLMGNQDVNGKIGVEIGNANTAGAIKSMGSTQAPVALAGRVPVKVTLEGGAIRPGDLLTSSSKAGYAMKATKTGRVVCMAMESYTAQSEGEKILCYVNPHQWVNPQDYADLKAEMEHLKVDVQTLKQKAAR